jgi:hypothetical protein
MKPKHSYAIARNSREMINIIFASTVEIAKWFFPDTRNHFPGYSKLIHHMLINPTGLKKRGKKQNQ